MKGPATRNGSPSTAEESRRLSRKLIFHLLLPALGVAGVAAILGWANEAPAAFRGGLAAIVAVVSLVFVARKPSPWLLLPGGIRAWVVAAAILLFCIWGAVVAGNPYLVLKALALVLPSVPFGFALTRVSMAERRAQEATATEHNANAELGCSRDPQEGNVSCSWKATGT